MRLLTNSTPQPTSCGTRQGFAVGGNVTAIICCICTSVNILAKRVNRHQPVPNTMKSIRHLVGLAITILPLQKLGAGAVSAGHSLQQMHEPTARQQSAPACSDGATIGDLWLVKDLNVTYTSDELVRPGNATFTITNNLTNETERIHCALRANYVCDIRGTPGDDSLTIWLQINLDVARFTLNQSLPCDNEPSRYVDTSAYRFLTSQPFYFADMTLSLLLGRHMLLGMRSCISSA